MSEKMSLDEAVNAMAASAIERAHDLIQDGWVKGTFYQKEGGAPVRFCILGALELAFMEMFGEAGRQSSIVTQVAQAFILDEAAAQYSYGGVSIPSFNDASHRTQEQVLSVLRAAANRLWNLSVNWENIVEFDPRTYAPRAEELEPEQARQYLYAVLA